MTDLTQADIYAAFMLDHATGALASELQLAGDLHVRLNQAGSEATDLWAIVGGVLLEDVAPEEGRTRRTLSQSGRDTQALADGLIGGSERLNWRRGLFGFDTAHLSPRLGRLLRMAPGKSVVEHGHNRLEATVILEGALDDGHAIYEVGDILFSWPGMRHKPRAVGEEQCVCYVGREKVRKKQWFSKH
jgi:anti-sigma factor ChrR (cupin superfamily)